MKNTINKIVFPYVLIIPIFETKNYFCLNTEKLANTHPPGTYELENNLTAEEIGQLLLGN